LWLHAFWTLSGIRQDHPIPSSKGFMKASIVIAAVLTTSTISIPALARHFTTTPCKVWIFILVVASIVIPDRYCFAGQTNPIINIEKFERTDAAIVIYGNAKNLLPAGTKMWATVKKINSKKIKEPDAISASDVAIDQNGNFKAVVKKFGNTDRYNFPDGLYEVEFYSQFSRAWQSLEVVKLAGCDIDDQGKTITSDPKLLPKSEDLIYENLFGRKVRVLKTTRTIKITKKIDARDPAMAVKTKKIRVEVHDHDSMKNPIKSFDGTNLSVKEAVSKIGRLGQSSAMVIACEGDFPAGYIANDLIFSGGRWNQEFKVNMYTMLMDICITQEKSSAKGTIRQ
jgi:hypothetical protein